MEKDPAILWYFKDWLAGTLGMTLAEKGAYMDLMAMQYSQGHISEKMAKQCVGKLWLNVKRKFHLDDNGLYYDNMLDEQIAKRKSYCESRRNNRKSTNICETHENHMSSHMGNANVNVNKNVVLDKKEIGECERKEREKRPTLEDIQAYCTERGNTVDAQRFIDYYSAQGWKLANGNAMKDWKAAVRTWESREKEKLTGNVFAKMLAEGKFDD